MCRLFALRATQPTRVYHSLVSAPHSLMRQSGCDAQQQKHDNGWGIGFFQDDQVQRVRSTLPADQDPHFRELAETLAAATVVAHVRQASIGTVAERNSHPFLHDGWLFAHNGTLFGFAAAPERLRALIPPLLRAAIEGDTDSEQAFFLFLTLLEREMSSRPAQIDPEAACQALAETIRILHRLYPREGDQSSAFNFVATGGGLLLASRWGRSLWWLRRQGIHSKEGERPIREEAGYQAVVIASEPTTEEAWCEVPERTIMLIRPDLTHSFTLT